MKRVELTHSAWKPVGCQYCRSRFAYQLTRTIVSKVDESRAKEAAVELKTKLVTELQQGGEAVPCPGCGRFQASMQPMLKMAHGAFVRAVSSAILAASGLMLTLYFINQMAAVPADTAAAWAGLRLLAVLWTVLGAMVLTSLVARHLFDPATHSNLAMAQRLIKSGQLRVEALSPSAARPAAPNASAPLAAGVVGAAAATGFGFSREAAAQSHGVGPQYQPAQPPGPAAASSAIHPSADTDADPFAALLDPQTPPLKPAAAPGADTWLDVADKADTADTGIETQATSGPTDWAAEMDINTHDLDTAIADAVGLANASEVAAATAEAATEVVADVVKDALS